MEANELAAVLNGREYRAEISASEEVLAKSAGLVVVFGASDDLMEFRGAISDELGAWEGATARLSMAGLLKSWEEVDKEDEDEMEAYFKAKLSGFSEIEAQWDSEGYSWTFRTDIPHATFEIVEDGEPYCRGIVFRLSDAAPRSPAQAASGSSQGTRSDGPVTKFGIKPHSTLAQLKDDEDLRLYVQAHIEEARAAEQGATPPAPVAPLGDGEQLWLWQNGDHFFAFRHLYPCFSPGGDPMTLGEPFGRAIFKHSHNREGKPNEQQRTDRQSPRSGAYLDLQRRHTPGAGQACSAGDGASIGYGQHQIAPQGGWCAGDDRTGPQPVPDIAGAAGVLAAGRNVAQGVAAQGDPSGALRPEPEAAGQDRADVPPISSETLQAIWDATATSDDRVMAFGREIIREVCGQHIALIKALKTHAGDVDGWQFGLGRVRWIDGSTEFLWATQEDIERAITAAVSSTWS